MVRFREYRYRRAYGRVVSSSGGELDGGRGVALGVGRGRADGLEGGALCELPLLLLGVGEQRRLLSGRDPRSEFGECFRVLVI